MRWFKREKRLSKEQVERFKAYIVLNNEMPSYRQIIYGVPESHITFEPSEIEDATVYAVADYELIRDTRLVYNKRVEILERRDEVSEPIITLCKLIDSSPDKWSVYEEYTSFGSKYFLKHIHTTEEFVFAGQHCQSHRWMTDAEMRVMILFIQSLIEQKNIEENDIQRQACIARYCK